MQIYIDSFKTFFKIGLFTFGGGYAMIPLIEQEVVDKKQWLSKDEFLDLLAVSQTIPGVFAVNMSIAIGYKLKKTKGSIVSALGTVLPSFLIILLIALFFEQFKDNPVVESIFRGIRPAVVALIAVPCFRLAQSARITYSTIWIPVIAAELIWIMGVSPIYIIAAACIGGYLYGKYVKPHDE